MVLIEFAILFCRWTIGFLFLYTSTTKFLSLKAFELTISNFRVLPKLLIKPLSFLIPFIELLLSLMIIIDRGLLMYTFILSGLLLMLFTTMFLVVLLRKMSIACNCFGNTQKPITWFDVGRNISFILICLLGANFSFHFVNYQSKSGFFEGVFCGFAAIIFVFIMMNLEELVTLLIESLT